MLIFGGGVHADTAEDWVQKGYDFYFYQEDYAQALNAYNQAILIDPSNYGAWDNKGLILSDLRKYSQAINAFDQCIKIDPTDCEAYYHKGDVFSSLKRYDEAIQYYDQVIKLAQDDQGDNNYRLGAFSSKIYDLGELKKFDEALAVCDQMEQFGRVVFYRAKWDPSYPRTEILEKMRSNNDGTT